MNKPADFVVRQAVEDLFNIQPGEFSISSIDASLKNRTLLHHWPLSRVERLEFRSSELPRLVFKAVLPPLEREVAVYEDLFSSNRRWAPTLYGSKEVNGETWMFLEDVGSVTLKKDPSFDNLIKAIVALAGLHVTFGREVTSGALQKRTRLNYMDFPAYVEAARDTFNLTQLLINRGKYSKVNDRQLAQLESVVELYDKVALTLMSAPQTLVHGDFDADNIALEETEDRIIMLDWANAFIGSALLDLVELSTFATNTFGSDIMSKLLQTYRIAYHASSGEPMAAEPMEEIFVCSQIEKMMSNIRWFNLCALRYIPTGVTAYDNSVSGLIDEIYNLSTILR